MVQVKAFNTLFNPKKITSLLKYHSVKTIFLASSDRSPISKSNKIESDNSVIPFNQSWVAEFVPVQS